eukprot:1194558-Prorocentrum_minimum.AAC.2
MSAASSPAPSSASVPATMHEHTLTPCALSACAASFRFSGKWPSEFSGAAAPACTCVTKGTQVRVLLRKRNTKDNCEESPNLDKDAKRATKENVSSPSLGEEPLGGAVHRGERSAILTTKTLKPSVKPLTNRSTTEECIVNHYI